MKANASVSLRLPPPGFTLVDILVAIAVIAVVIAIMLPVMGRAGRSVERARAVHHMRQIGAAFHAFALENKGILPQYRPYGSSVSSGNGSNAFWPSWINPYLNGNYADLHDPAHIRLLGEKNPGTTYAMHTRHPRPFWPVAGVETPGRAMLLATVAVDSPNSGYRIAPGEVEDTPSQMGFHHNGKALVLYLDGHVEALAPDDVPPWAARASSHKRYPEFKAFWDSYQGPGVTGPTLPANR